MLTSLGIRNYRGFESLDIERLGRINLIAGKNNSGKTSLLEAIFLLSGGGRADLVRNPFIMRAKTLPNTFNRSVVFDRLNLMFFEYNTNSTIKIRGNHDILGDMELKITRPPQITIKLNHDEMIIFDMNDRLDVRDYLFSFSGACTKTEIESRAQVGTDELHITGSENARTVFSCGVVDVDRSNSVNEAHRLGNLRQRKQDVLVLKALKEIESDIRSIETNPGFGYPMIVVDIGLDKLMPLSVMGEGINRLALKMIYLCGIPGGVLLIDEFENGLHHSVLPKVWKALEMAALDLNVQIVATTHSYECVEAAHKALDPANLLLHRLEAGERGNRCVTDDAESIETALYYNMEVR